MPKTKKDLVADILSIEEVDTKANLMKKNNGELEEILASLQEDATKAPQNSDSQPNDEDLMAKAKMKAELLAELKEQARKEVEAEMDTVEEKPVKKMKVEVDRNEQIPIMNITNGQLVYASKKSGLELHWGEYGDIEYVDFQELLTMRSSQRRFFDEPFIFIMHDDAVEQLGLTKMYENIKDPQYIERVFKMGQAEFQEVLEKSPRGIKHLIISRAKELYDKGEFDSVRKIKYINETFNTDIGERRG